MNHDEAFRQLYNGRYFHGTTHLDDVELRIDVIYLDHSARYEWILTMNEGVFVAWVEKVKDNTKWTMSDCGYNKFMFFKMIKSITFKINDTETVLFKLQE